jgi:regulatory protein
MGFGKSSLTLSVKGRALRYLSQREHSRQELARKLARFVEDTADASAQVQIATALDDLSAKDLLSDARAAASVLNAQGARYGSRRLKQTLQSKGLDAELVSSTLAQARQTELARAREVWRRRFGVVAEDAAARAKQMRFLAGRGFDGDIIRRVVQAEAEEGED